jgi:hypothetical protein
MKQELSKEIFDIRQKIREVRGGVKMVATRCGCSEQWVQNVLNEKADGEAILKVLEVALEVIAEHLEAQRGAKQAMVDSFKKKTAKVLAVA